jgi:hypothetical protein
MFVTTSVSIERLLVFASQKEIDKQSLAPQNRSFHASGSNNLQCVMSTPWQTPHTPQVSTRRMFVRLTTVALLEKNHYFGMDKHEIDLIKQEKVASLVNNNCEFALVDEKENPYGTLVRRDKHIKRTTDSMSNRIVFMSKMVHMKF